MWKKQTAISGVSSRSVVELKALLFQEVERVKRSRAEGEQQQQQQRRKKRKKEEQEEGNKGVETRRARDLIVRQPQLQVNGERVCQNEVVVNSLREKATKYDEISQGSAPLPQQPVVEDDARECMVDFAYKQAIPSPSTARNIANLNVSSSIFSEPTEVSERNAKTKVVEDYLEEFGNGEPEINRRKEHREVLESVIQETQEEKQKALQTQNNKRATQALKLALIRKKQKESQIKE